MKKLAAVLAVLMMGLFLATPAMAGHRGHSRGHGHRIVRGTTLGFKAVTVPHFRAPRFHSGVSVSFGYPSYYRYPVYYRPVPVYYYPSAPVVVVPEPCEPVWVPGHYVREDGVRFYVSGHWSH